MSKPHYTAKPIIRDGALVGWKMYTPGILGSQCFARYLWLKEST